VGVAAVVVVFAGAAASCAHAEAASSHAPEDNRTTVMRAVLRLLNQPATYTPSVTAFSGLLSIC